MLKRQFDIIFKNFTSIIIWQVNNYDFVLIICTIINSCSAMFHILQYCSYKQKGFEQIKKNGMYGDKALDCIFLNCTQILSFLVSLMIFYDINASESCFFFISMHIRIGHSVPACVSLQYLD